MLCGGLWLFVCVWGGGVTGWGGHVFEFGGLHCNDPPVISLSQACAHNDTHHSTARPITRMGRRAADRDWLNSRTNEMIGRCKLVSSVELSIPPFLYPDRVLNRNVISPKARGRAAKYCLRTPLPCFPHAPSLPPPPSSRMEVGPKLIPPLLYNNPYSDLLWA